MNTKSIAIMMGSFSVVLGGAGAARAAGDCSLSKGKGGAIPLVERNLSTFEKNNPAKASDVRRLQSELQSLAQRGEAFTAKAEPIEAECRGIEAELARMKGAWAQLDLDRKPLRDRIAVLRKTWDGTILPRGRTLDAEVGNYKSAGCGRTFNMKTEAAAYHRCEAWRVALQGRIDAHKAESSRIRSEWTAIDARSYAMGADYRRAFEAFKVRQQKYRAARGAYRTERMAWETAVRAVWGTTTTLIAESGRKAPVGAERRAALQKLRGQVAGIQEVLRRLNRSMLGDAAQRAEWEKATHEAMQNAWDRGKGMVIDEGLGVLGKRLETQLASANQELQRAVTVLSGEKDPARRERLHAAVKLLGQQRDDVRRAKDLVVDRVADAKKVVDAVDYATSNPGDLEKSLKGAFSLVTTTLGDPKVQKALKVGGGYAAGAGYAQSIVESSLDITTEVVAWKRINQLNRNSDGYLKAVNRMKDKMEKTVEKIQALEAGKLAGSTPGARR